MFTCFRIQSSTQTCPNDSVIQFIHKLVTTIRLSNLVHKLVPTIRMSNLVHKLVPTIRLSNLVHKLVPTIRLRLMISNLRIMPYILESWNKMKVPFIESRNPVHIFYIPLITNGTMNTPIDRLSSRVQMK